MTKEEAIAEAAEQLRQHPEWALIVENPRFFACPSHITTAEEAFTALGHYLWCWSRQNPAADQIDQRLAAFAKANPGTLEALLADPERQQILAHAQGGVDAQMRRDQKLFGGRPTSLLSLFVSEGSVHEDRALWQTLQTLRPRALLVLCVTAAKHFELGLGRLAYTLLKTHGKALDQEARALLTGDVPLAVLDELDAIAQTDDTRSYCFPDILPPEEALVQLTPDEIRATLAHYTGLSPEAFQARLVRGKFLADGEHVGEVIRRDALTLLMLGVTRHRLAEALIEVSRSKRDVTVVRWRGYHREPFHTEVAFGLSREVGGSEDVTVTNRKAGETIAFGSMLPYLIRRACFFEGAVPYRLDPAAACRVLEPWLVNARG